MPPISAKYSNVTHVLGGNISLRNKIPLVLPFKGFPPMTKQVTNSFFYIKLNTLSFRGVSTVIYSKNFEWLNHSIWVHPRTTAIRQNGKAKRNMSLRYTCVTCKETAENGVLLKEYLCVHASQVNYGKPSDSNKIVRQIQWIFSFLKLFKQKLNC